MSSIKPLRTLPTFGNLVIEERAASVALRLRTDRDGTALFTYAEIATLSEILGRIQRPASPEPVTRGVFD